MRIDLIYGVRLLIIALIAYIPTVTISGWFTAWVAKRCDDDLPERFGFLTFDPFSHFSIVGFAILLIGELFGQYITFFRGIPGFGRFIILDPQPTNGKLKIIAEFFARSFAHFVMLTISLIVIFSFPNAITPLLLSSRDILVFFYTQNLYLCGIYFLFGIADIICFFYNIPRMFSVGYFAVLIVVLLSLGTPVDYLFSRYSKVIYFLVSGVFHA